MKNIPRIFIDENLATDALVTINKDIAHYLTRVMRTNNCLVFNNGSEFMATLDANTKHLKIGDKTDHTDPSSNLVLYFAPIKKIDDLLNMSAQMGVAKFQPVITDRTVANHINWERMKKILISAAEQSNRNSVPEILSPMMFSALDTSGVIFADERVAHGANITNTLPKKTTGVLIGPEGGFSDAEFKSLDTAGAVGISLGKTILRAEVAAVVALAKIL